MIPAKQFIFAGAAVFTLSQADRHYTYRVRRKDPSETEKRQYHSYKHGRPPETIWLVSIGIGYEDSIYAGIMKSIDATQVTFTKASRFEPAAPSMQMLCIFLEAIKDGLYNEETCVAGSIRFQHEGRCCMCARPLTNPESIDAGIGPECAGKLG
jgi:hypothetical protein